VKKSPKMQPIPLLSKWIHYFYRTFGLHTSVFFHNINSYHTYVLVWTATFLINYERNQLLRPNLLCSACSTNWSISQARQFHWIGSRVSSRTFAGIESW
jgi:hypothetical protein